MKTTEERGLDENSEQCRSLLIRIRNLRLTINMGNLVNSLVTISIEETTLQWIYLFTYLLNLLCKNISYRKFVGAGIA